jgi:hypothetical protein
VGDCFCIRGKSERARAIVVPRGRRICVKTAPATVSTIDITTIRWSRKGLSFWLMKKQRPGAGAGPYRKIDAKRR